MNQIMCIDEVTDDEGIPSINSLLF